MRVMAMQPSSGKLEKVEPVIFSWCAELKKE
jgi:hypothetical protein